MNFAFWLLLLSLISGIVYALDYIFWEKKREIGQAPHKIIEYARSFFPVLITVLLLRSFFMEPFRIPSGSLEPTLLIGDFLVVNKFSDGIRLPVFETKILDTGHPKRGDITVFRWPPNPKFDYIKRVIGVPGDNIVYHNKVLTINGIEAKQTLKEYTTDPSSGNAVALYQEDLLGIKHDIFVRTDLPAKDFDITVPANQYFMMGDNRDDSADSRFWGFVGDEYLRGKALFIWMSWDNQLNSLRWRRIGSLIH